MRPRTRSLWSPLVGAHLAAIRTRGAVFVCACGGGSQGVAGGGTNAGSDGAKTLLHTWAKRFALAASVGLLVLTACGSGSDFSGGSSTFGISGTITGATGV